MGKEKGNHKDAKWKVCICGCLKVWICVLTSISIVAFLYSKADVGVPSPPISFAILNILWENIGKTSFVAQINPPPFQNCGFCIPSPSPLLPKFLNSPMFLSHVFLLYIRDCCWYLGCYPVFAVFKLLSSVSQVSSWQKFWVGLRGALIYYYLPKHRHLGTRERSAVSDRLWKVLEDSSPYPWTNGVATMLRYKWGDF